MIVATAVGMRSLFVIAALVSCGRSGPGTGTPVDSPQKVDLSGDITCGSHTCHTGQICVTEYAGHTCWTNDAGVGEYGIHDQFCEDLPAECDSTVTCDCLTCEGLCLGTSGRELSCGCY